jgi:hypothetical protein
MPKPTQHQQPVEHYQQAERTLAALASVRIDALPDLAIIEALAALTHAVLASIPARRTATASPADTSSRHTPRPATDGSRATTPPTIRNRRRTIDAPRVGTAPSPHQSTRPRRLDTSGVGAEVVEQGLLGDLDQPTHPYHRRRPSPVTHQLIGQGPANPQQPSCLEQIKDRRRIATHAGRGTTVIAHNRTPSLPPTDINPVPIGAGAASPRTPRH